MDHTYLDQAVRAGASSAFDLHVDPLLCQAGLNPLHMLNAVYTQ
jgi:hypothetical protein